MPKGNKQKMENKVKNIICIIVIIIMLPILIFSGGILVNSYIYPNEVPSFLGWKPFIVLSGSMETKIYAGDIAVVKAINPKDIKNGDIIAFKQGDKVSTHRIVNIVDENNERKIYTKGDNNDTPDDGYVRDNEIEGVFKFRIPKLGDFAMFIQTPTGIAICLSIPLIVLVIMQILESKKYAKGKEEQEQMKAELTKLKEKKKDLSKK